MSRKGEIMKFIRDSRTASLILTTVLAVGISIWVFARATQKTVRNNIDQAIPYRVLRDDMGSVISIAVDYKISEEQLRATLSRAATDHEDDRARDYLTSMYLLVEAFLVNGERQSRGPAGSLRRYVPPGNAQSRKKISGDRTKQDAFTITLDEATKSLQ